MCTEVLYAKLFICGFITADFICSRAEWAAVCDRGQSWKSLLQVKKVTLMDCGTLLFATWVSNVQFDFVFEILIADTTQGEMKFLSRFTSAVSSRSKHVTGSKWFWCWHHCNRSASLLEVSVGVTCRSWASPQQRSISPCTAAAWGRSPLTTGIITWPSPSSESQPSCRESTSAPWEVGLLQETITTSTKVVLTLYILYNSFNTAELYRGKKDR